MGEGRLAFCMDPTGAAFGLWQPMRHTGARVVDEHGAMTWAEVNTRDAVKARDFYASVFGAEPSRLEGENMEYYTLKKGDKTFGGVLQMNDQWPANVPPHWMAYFAVDDADAAARRVTELGGKVMHGPFDTPYGRIAVVSDPAGAVFSIIKLSSPAS
jgi:predicted enzyme related to lactoylglutathione lyase